MAFSQSRFFIILIFLVGLSNSLAMGQQRLGVKWHIPDDTDTALQQLAEFDQWGISVLEINQLPADTVWQSISNKEMTVYGNIGINFPISTTFANPDSALVQQIETKARGYLSEPSVRAIGLFNFGHIADSTFQQSVTPVARQLQKVRQVALYYTSSSSQANVTVSYLNPLMSISVTPANVDSIMIPDLPAQGYFYAPSKELKPLLGPFKKFISALSTASQSVLFVKSDWVLSMEERYPQFATILKSISTESSPAFPLPQEKMPSPSNSVFPIIALFVVWLTVGVHYHMSPLYRKSTFRYFTAHKFFINDIFKRLIRSPIPAVVILFQHALLVALAVSTLFSNLLKPIGREALFYHFENLAVFGENVYSIFAWTFVAVLVFTFFEVIWLLLTHKKIKSFTQITTIFAWPLQINFLFCTVVIAFYLQSTSMPPVVFTALALLLFFLSFIFTATDLSRFARSKAAYHLKTTLPYSILISGLITWLVIHHESIEIVSLAISLT